MTLRSRISHDLKQALAGQDKVQIATLRLIQTAIRDRDSALRARGAGREMRDDEILAVLARMVEMRQESLRSYEEAGQLDLVEREETEIALIAAYLPRQMDADETGQAIDAVVRDLKAQSIRDMGRVMAVLKARHGGHMDIAAAGPMVRARLSPAGTGQA